MNILPNQSTMDQTTNAVSGTVLGLTVFGVSMPDLAALAAFCWIVIQAAFFLYGKFKKGATTTKE